MVIEGYLLTSLLLAAGKFLFKKYLGEDGQILGANGEILHNHGLLGEPGDVVAEVLCDLAKDKIKNMLDRRRAVSDMEKYSLEIIRQIESRLDSEQKENPGIDVQLIAEQIAQTLKADISLTTFLKEDLDPRKVVAAFESARPLPHGILDVKSDLVYVRMLEYAVQCLIGVAGQLPDFHASAVKESLRRLRNLDDSVELVLEKLAHMTRTVERFGGRGDSQKYEIEYRQAVAANLDYIDLFGVTIPRELKRFQLTEAFVSLNLQRRSEAESDQSRSQKAASRGRTSQEDGELLSCDAVFDRLRPGEGRLLVRGAAGSGKTTLMRWVAIQAAQMEGVGNLSGIFVSSSHDSGRDDEFLFDLNPHPWRSQIPFVVLLRHCRDGKLPLAESFPELIGEGIGKPPVDWVRTILKEGRGLVLIDGVDEVPPDQRNEIVNGIDQLLKHYPDSYFVVTTRPEAVPENWLSELGFLDAHVNPMGGADVDQFIRRWYEAEGRYHKPAGKPENLSDRRQNLLSQLESNEALRPLATNPLMCAMICALHLDSSGTLPESQSALCDQLCDMLIHRREREQRILDDKPFPAAYVGLTVDQKRTLIQDLAIYMVQEGRSALTFAMAEERIGRRLAGFKDRSSDDSKIVLSGLLERSGVLREPVPEEVDFLHNTFKEYLAGEYFASERMTNTLLDHVFGPPANAEAWRRVTLFAAGSRRAPDGFAQGLIQLLLSVSDEPDAVPRSSEKKKRRSKKEVLSDPVRQRHLLALQCQIVADGRGLPTEVKMKLAGLVEMLFPPRTLSDAESLAILRDQAIPYLKRPANRKQGVQAAVRCIRALRMINTSSSRLALKDYFDIEDVGAVAELSQAVDPLRLPIVRRWISQASECPGEVRARISDLSLLV